MSRKRKYCQENIKKTSRKHQERKDNCCWASRRAAPRRAAPRRAAPRRAAPRRAAPRRAAPRRAGIATGSPHHHAQVVPERGEIHFGARGANGVGRRGAPRLQYADAVWSIGPAPACRQRRARLAFTILDVVCACVHGGCESNRLGAPDLFSFATSGVKGQRFRRFLCCAMPVRMQLVAYGSERRRGAVIAIAAILNAISVGTVFLWRQTGGRINGSILIPAGVGVAPAATPLGRHAGIRSGPRRARGHAPLEPPELSHSPQKE